MDLSDGIEAAHLHASLTKEGDDVLYFPIKIAVSRLGGVKAVAQALNETETAVQLWMSPVQRTRPSSATLEHLSALSGVSLASFHRYFSRLALYKTREGFRRRRKKAAP